MSLEWKDVVLKDVLSEKGYIRGPFGSALKRSKMKSEGIPVYEQQNAIYDNRIFRYYIDDEKYQSLKRFTTLPNDLIISCSGTVGKVSIIKENDPKGIISQALLTLRVNNELIHPEFLKYFFTSYEGYNSLVSRSTGSVQVNISKRAVIEEIPIKLPPLDIQEKIVYYLKLIDKKIEVNEGINKNLEEQLCLIFNDWFVKCTPYNGEQLIKTEWGYVPKSWKDIEFGELIEITSGDRPDEKSEDKTSEFNIPLFGASKIMGYTKEASYNEDILIIGRVGTHGVVQRVNYPCFPSDNTFVIKSDYYGFVYQLLKRIDYDSLNTGSTQPLITQKSLKTVNAVLPDENILFKFEMFSKTVFNEIQLNNHEIFNLTKLRDTLLPKLMSGEIDVSKINCDLKIIIRKIYIKSSKLFLWRYLSENQNHIKNTKSNETLLKSRTIHKINKFLAKFNARYRYYRQ